ncbi:hypothetical protein GF386_05370 [Candidatus Pacearchaeota archaeon]|nr:hypothetical protein [Candidatus Pacearchaeota archaeon]MBD3283518.1 hypothetical protein [Candidatus Pacearchaeota archaeon]
MSLDKIVFERTKFSKFIRYTVTLVIVVLLILFIFGFIGNYQADKIDAVCDIGFRDIFCWKWHKEVVLNYG